MTNESSAEISLVSELPGALYILEDTVVKQYIIHQPNRSPRPRLGDRMEPGKTDPRILLSRQDSTIVQLPCFSYRGTQVRVEHLDRYGTRKDGSGSGLVSVWEHSGNWFVRFERWDLAASWGRR